MKQEVVELRRLSLTTSLKLESAQERSSLTYLRSPTNSRFTLDFVPVLED